jgi:hypothetical protein
MEVVFQLYFLSLFFFFLVLLFIGCLKLQFRPVDFARSFEAEDGSAGARPSQERVEPVTTIQNMFCDAEHPLLIPMDTTQTSSEPMTRARARAIQSEVTSLLLEFPLHSSETWLLPKSETLCVIRYDAQATEPRAGEEGTGDNSLFRPEVPARARNLRPPRNFRPPTTQTRPSMPTLWLARNQPGTWPGPSVAQNFRPARTFRPPDASPNPTVPTLWLGRTLPGPLPGTSGARNFRPCLRAVTRAEAHVPFRP